jgi:hypothetical protein
MIKKISLSFAAMLMLGPAWGQTNTLKVKPKNDALEVCVPSYVKKYAALCETAETAARGVAFACAPKPRPKTPAYDGNQGLQWEYAIAETEHEAAYAKALVAILDARAQTPPACTRQ